MTVKVTVDEEKSDRCDRDRRVKPRRWAALRLRAITPLWWACPTLTPLMRRAGATVTSTAVKEALAKALGRGEGRVAVNDAAVAFTAGTYTGTAKGLQRPG